jgi:hypothetical protein
MEIFKPNTINEKKHFKPKLVTILLSSILVLQVLELSNKSYANYQLKKDPSIQLGEAAEDFCLYTTKSLISGKFSSLMFDEVTYKGLKADPNYFDFKDDETVKLVKVVGDQCRVITVSSLRMKGFLITLNKSLKNPLYYKAIQINEEDEAFATNIADN